ncbi:MAG TPA: histidine kinase, partial [Solirubrobacteraceae bacterium]|nr:histidine kinase [Solirubrobacteraceae bacterium]
MIGLKRALVVLGALGVALAGVAVVLAVESTHMEEAGPIVAASVVLMLSYIGVGLYAWWRRPTNRVGTLMTAVGFATFLSALQLSNSSLLFTFGLVVGGGLFFAVGVHLLMAFPTGRIESGLERRVVAAGYVFAIGIPLAIVATSPESFVDEPEKHPDNAFLVIDDQSVGDVVERVGGVLGIGLVSFAAYVLVRRARAAGPRERRAMAPMLWLGTVMLLLLCLSFAFDVPSHGAGDVELAVDFLGLIAFAALPYAFLAGLARTRSWRAGAIGEVLEALGDAPGRGRLRDALREALGDPSLRIAYWLPDRAEYVDVEGRTLELPERGVPGVEREGVRVGALVHDPVLGEDDPDLVRAVASAAALALENERLDAELRARVAELQRSRALLVDAALSERRRLERDLHDGAQQRLVALSLQRGMSEAQLEKRPDAARELLAGARDEARAALEDLRELARGIHPAVLTDRGLKPALESLADRAPLPVEVGPVPEERLPGAVEAAAYFVVAESLTNVAKYAEA